MDALALSLAEEMRVKGWAQELPVAQQIFALMPLRHSPSLDRCVRAHTPATLTECLHDSFQSFLTWVKRSLEIHLTVIYMCICYSCLIASG